MRDIAHRNETSDGPVLMTQLYAVEQLKEAIRELKVFMDPKNVECDVRQDARGTATQMYLESWVLAPLEEALKILEGNRS